MSRCITVLPRMLPQSLTPARRLLLRVTLPHYSEPQSPLPARRSFIWISERRQLARFPLRMPVRFKAMDLPRTKRTLHQRSTYLRAAFISQPQRHCNSMPIEASLRMPAEVTGDKPKETHCRARVVHVRNEPYGDGRIGFGAEIESFVSVPPADRWTNQPPLP